MKKKRRIRRLILNKNETGISFSPLDIPDLALWLAADKITGLADGAEISQWNDSSGNGNHVTQTVAGKKPIYSATGIKGIPEVCISYRDMATDIVRWMNIPDTVSVDAQNHTLVVIGRTVSKALNTGYTVPLAIGNYKLGWGGLEPTVAYPSVLHEGPSLTYFEPGFISNVSTPTKTRICYNGVFEDGVSTPSGSSSGGTIGADGGEAYKTYGTLNEVQVYNRALSDTEIGQLFAYAQRKYTSVNPTKQMIFDGDSLTTGYACINNANYPGQTWGLLGKDWKFYCLPVAGQTLVNMQNDAATEVDPLYDESLSENILVCWAGVLDLYYGADVSTTMTRLETYCKARRAAGWKVVVLNCLPSDFITSASSRAAVNEGIANNWIYFADALANIAGDSRIGDDGDNLNPVYFNNSDGVHTHMTPAGFAIVANITATAIGSITGIPQHFSLSVHNVASGQSGTF